jgi:hypothetical protein
MDFSGRYSLKNTKMFRSIQILLAFKSIRNFRCDIGLSRRCEMKCFNHTTFLEYMGIQLQGSGLVVVCMNDHDMLRKSLLHKPAVLVLIDQKNGIILGVPD